MNTIQDKFSGNFSNRAAQKAVIAQARKDDNSPTIKDYSAHFVLPESWQSLQISTKINDEEVVQDISILTPVKVQFLLQYWNKQIVETLRARQIELDQEKSNFEKIYIKENSSNRKSSPDAIHVAINALEENLDDIVVRSLRMSAEKQAEILLSTVYTTDLAAKKVALYKQKSDGICLVGFKDGVLQTYDVINSLFTNNSPCARHVRISFFDAQLFAKLEFIEHTKTACSSKIDISIDTKNQIILMNKASVSDVHDVVDKINAFRKGVVQTEFNTTRAKAALLRLNETQKSLEEIFKSENLNCYVHYGSELIHIHTRTDEDGKIVAMILETSIQEITVRKSFVESEKFFIILEKFKGKILIEHSENIYTCKICCTNDALADISMAMVNKDHPKFLTEKKTEKPCNKENGGIATFGQMFFDKKPKKIQKQLSKQQNRNTDEKKKFTTKEEIDIYVYSESILQLDVDCIVNAANERLGHGAGVAAVIARGAGYKLEEEGKDYIEQYGPIPVGECCHTTAGKLPYKYVIHTVGPRWGNSMTLKEQERCKKELQSAIESCFYEADFLRMKSIGVPSVSAGIFGMPPYICAKQYLEAVLNYSQQRTWSSEPTTLKEIHFIDMNIEMCKVIADVFSQYFH